MDCIFCKIAVGEIPNYTVYEDANVLAFLDIHPHAKGHTVIIPKKHFASVAEMSDEEWSGLMLGIKKAAEKVKEVLQPDGMNIGLNDGVAAGQVVQHVHWHIFPRWTGDGGGSVHSIIKQSEDINAGAVAEMFKK